MTLPGEMNERQKIDRIIRVDHAGEYGAMRIYQGQLAVLKDPEARRITQEMLEGERPHLKAFSDLIAERRVRPTLLMPLWEVGGWMLGAVTAAMGPKAAMACTEAVEEVISEHYASQSAMLGETEAPLKATIDQFRADEEHHHRTAQENNASEAPLYPALNQGIKAITRAAIWLSSRI